GAIAFAASGHLVARSAALGLLGGAAWLAPALALAEASATARPSRRNAAIAGLALVLAALGYGLYEQAQHLARLDRALDSLRERLDETAPSDAAPAAATNLQLPPQAGAASAAPAAPRQPVSAPAAPRVALSPQEVAHVESAVLTLLESDRPELRAKLRAVVQEQQQTLEQEQREQRRERWITRQEARLLEVGGEVGLTAEQRKAMMVIMLGTRDQLTDMRQSAETPEAIAQTRPKMRELREQSDAQLRELLQPAQYEAYRARFSDDDDERGPRRPDRPERSARTPAGQP
ncbi:MAG TPA: hypothetical protein VK509_11005, partial [Polyangiales bacterium]|nr:hypothetical protein [Polyangiales bacterium]